MNNEIDKLTVEFEDNTLILKRKTILITGINGFLGSNLAKRLTKEYEIIGLEFSTENLFRIKEHSFKVYSSMKENIEQIFEKNIVDVVIHTATVYRNTGQSLECLIKSNILLPVKLYELSQKFNIECFINTDSFFNNSSYDYSYLGEYTLSKRHSIEWLKAIQIDVKLVNMKIFHMYGIDDSPNKFVTQIVSLLTQNVEKIDLTLGLQKRDFIYIDDVVEAYYIVIKNLKYVNNGYEEFEVGTGVMHSIRDFVTIAAGNTICNTKLDFGALSYRNGEIMESVANNSKLLSLGWKSKIELKMGIVKLINSIAK